MYVCVLVDEDVVMGHMYSSEEPDGVPPELSPFLTRCFIARVRCLLDSTSGFLVSHEITQNIQAQWFYMELILCHN